MGGKHLTLDDRIRIEQNLLLHRSARQIADLLHVSHTTVSRELLARRRFQPGEDAAACPAACLRLPGCPFRRGGRECGESCPDFTPRMPCPRLNRAPFVCTGCPDFAKCRRVKMLYLPDKAQEACLAPGLAKGQSPCHLLAASPGRVPVSLRTVYRYIAEGILPSLRKPHLQRAAGMKPRKGRRRECKVDPHCRDRRAYGDFLKFREAHPDTAVAEMDTVLGARGGRCLLTLHLGGGVPLQLAFVRPANTAASAAEALDLLERRLGTALFRKLLPAILTDNGSEFTDPARLEASALLPGRRRTRVFYCEPYSSWQKPMVEGSNAYLRRIFPKGVPVPDVAQEAVDLAVSHVNAKLREALNGKSATDLFVAAWGRKVLELTGLRQIDPKEANLTPEVLGTASPGGE